MGKKANPPKNTGGGGFAFEDKVSAWYFLCMLSHFKLFDDELGYPTQISFQANGWKLDDALVTTGSQLGEHRFAVSIKSNQQFTAKKAPSDFVSRIWYHWVSLCEENIFNKEKDYLVLVTSPLSEAAKKSISGLMDKAILADPECFSKDILAPGWADENQRELFKSFHPLDQLVQNPEVETARLLQRLRFLEYDFDSTTSFSLQNAIKFCKENVKSHSEIDANNLWNLLCAIAAKYRPRAGSMTLKKLLSEIGGQIDLSEYPDYRSDWEKLSRQSTQMSERIHNTLGETLHITRGCALDELETLVSKEPLLVIEGDSGSGKSALLKTFYDSKVSTGIPVLWIDVNALDDINFQQFEHSLGLQYSLNEIIEQVRSKSAFIILEGVDRLYSKTAFANVVTFLELVSQADSRKTWHIMMSCQTKEWGRVSGEIHQLHLNNKWSIYSLPKVTLQEIVGAIQGHPKVVQLFLQPQLDTIFQNLKVLDLVVQNVERGSSVNVAELTSEASVANWFWMSTINIDSNRIARGKCVRSLSVILADELRAFIHVDRLEDNDAIQSLVKNQIIYLDDKDRVSFAHDLYADWVRLHIIQAQDNITSFFQNRHDQPLWYRAMRLYGLSILEGNDSQKWSVVFDELSGVGYYSLTDALLEAPIFSTNPFEHLNALLPILLNDAGKLLRKLLSNFMMFGTQPNQEMVLLTTQQGLNAVTARTFYRIPYWLLWIDVLQFLYTNKESVLMVAKQEVARIIELWLSTTPINTRMRSEICEMALLLGSYAYEHRKDGGLKSKDAILYYQCLFLAVPERIDDVVNIALKAAQRSTTTEVQREGEYDDYSDGVVRSIRGRLVHYGPWNDGPKAKVEQSFKKVVLDPRYLIRLFQLQPQVAREIVMATIIKAPYAKGKYENYDLDDRTELQTDQLFYPPFYTNGPFLNFLKINFEEGLKLIIELVKFAIDRLIDNEKEDVGKKEKQIPKEDLFLDMWKVEPFNTSIILYDGEQEKSYIGGKRAYDTLSGKGIRSDAVVVALMSLEQYFYEQIEQGKDVAKDVDLTLKYARNTAVLAVLCNVGKKKIEFFQGALKVLFSCAEVYSWDIESVVTPLVHTNPGSMPPNEYLWNLGQQYFSQKHRKIELRHIAIHLMLHKPEMRSFFDALVLYFKKELKKSGENADLKENMITFLDYSNYEFEKQANGQIAAINMKEKQRQEQNPNLDKEMRVHHLLLTLPLKCRKVLDTNTVCNDEDLDALWDQWSSLWDEYLQSPEKLTRIGGNKIGDEAVNAISACIPVFLFHDNWCSKDTEREHKIVTVIDHLLQHPPVRSFNFGYTHDLSWECFIIEAVTLLWCRYPQNKKWRGLVAGSATTHNLKFVQIIFFRASRAKATLHNSFSQLQRLVIEWAYIKPYTYVLRENADNSHVTKKELQKAKREIEEWYQRKTDIFLNGDGLPLPESWEECNEIEQLKTLKKINSRWLSGGACVAMDLVYHAHLWLPSLSASLGKEERKEAINAWHNIVNLMTSNRQSRESYRNDFPDENEFKILEQVGAILPYLNANEEPRLFWQPIFELSEKEKTWAERMLHHLHSRALRAETLPTFYITLVRSLVESVFEGNNKLDKWGSWSTVWDALIGIDWFNKNAWEEKNIECAKELKGAFLLWMQYVPINAERLRDFAEWLVMPAAAPMQFDGLFWILEKMNSNQINLSQCAESFVILLNMMWENDQEKIRNDAEIGQKFRELLLLLQKDGSQLALELSARLANPT